MLMTATVPAALGIAIVAIDGRTPDTIGIALASTWDAVACLACGTPARRVLTDGFKTGVQVRSHTYKRELEPVLKPCLSRYRRTLADLPWQGLAVRLSLEMRRFFCDCAVCPRRIFAEPFPGLAPARSRRTARLTALYRAVGRALGREPGARLVGELGLPISPDTLLRLIRAREMPSPQAVRVLGVDDWAARRGQAHGAILVDLERRTVLDLLPDRETETLRVWLAQHPEVAIISRDRASTGSEARWWIALEQQNQRRVGHVLPIAGPSSSGVRESQLP